MTLRHKIVYKISAYNLKWAVHKKTPAIGREMVCQLRTRGFSDADVWTFCKKT